MKFKIAVTGFLAAILATCVFTSYKLITEAEKQTQLQHAQTEVQLGIGEFIKQNSRNNFKEEHFEGFSGSVYLNEGYEKWKEIAFPD